MNNNKSIINNNQDMTSHRLSYRRVSMDEAVKSGNNVIEGYSKESLMKS